MMTRLAANRVARQAALRLGQNGNSVPLSQLKRIVQKLMKNQAQPKQMPPEAALEESNDIKIVAFEMALAIHNSMIAAQPEYLRAVDVHKWPQMIRGIYYQILKDLR
jgi:hypothetical protein